MAINRRFLYAGLFLVAIGGVVVLVELAVVDTTAITSALRLWPLAWIAIGAGIVLRRSRLALVAGILAAMIPGLTLGGFAAVAPRHGLDCAAGVEPAETTTQHGTLTTPANVSVFTSCGSISIGMQPGGDWQLTSSNVVGRTPDVELTDEGLRIQSGGGQDWAWLETGRDTWSLSLPTTPMELVRVGVEAGRANIALPGATIGALLIDGTGAEIVADLSSTKVGEVDGNLDFGRLAIQLPQQGPYTGAFRLSAGELRLCIPSGLGLHVDFAGSAREVRVNDLYKSTTNRAELSVKVSFGSVAINPVIGGCK
jgi:hypothetical protein